MEGWLDLLRRRPVTGGEVFDSQLAATMLANGVNRMYTYNTGDFGNIHYRLVKRRGFSG